MSQNEELLFSQTILTFRLDKKVAMCLLQNIIWTTSHLSLLNKC